MRFLCFGKKPKPSTWVEESDFPTVQVVPQLPAPSTASIASKKSMPREEPLETVVKPAQPVKPQQTVKPLVYPTRTGWEAAVVAGAGRE